MLLGCFPYIRRGVTARSSKADSDTETSDVAPAGGTHSTCISDIKTAWTSQRHQNNMNFTDMKTWTSATLKLHGHQRRENSMDITATSKQHELQRHQNNMDIGDIKTAWTSATSKQHELQRLENNMDIGDMKTAWTSAT